MLFRSLIGAINNSGGTIAGAGGSLVIADAALSSGALAGSGDIALSGTNALAGVNISGAGLALDVNSGTTGISGGSNAGLLHADGGTLALTGTIANSGSVVVDSTAILNGVAIAGGGTAAFTNNGSTATAGGTANALTNGAGFVNNGSMTVSDASSLSVDGGYVQNSGSTFIGQNATLAGNMVVNGGSVAGSGAIAGDVTINAGANLTASSATGPLTIEGNYDQYGTLTIDFGPSGFTQLGVTGIVTLESGSILDLVVQNGFKPDTNATYNFLTSPMISGNFSFTNASTVFGSGWKLDAASGALIYVPAVVPEPDTCILIGAGLLVLGYVARRKQKRQNARAPLQEVRN